MGWVPIGVGRVFVYGTLMPGQPLWPTLAPFAESWAPASTPGRLWDTGSGYPAARFSPGDDHVLPGVVVTIPAARLDEALVVLDRVEEVGVLYRRVEVATSAGAALAYEWLGSTEGLAVLAGGWLSPSIPDAQEGPPPGREAAPLEK